MSFKDKNAFLNFLMHIMKIIFFIGHGVISVVCETTDSLQ